MEYKRIRNGTFYSETLFVLFVMSTALGSVQTAFTAAMESEIRSETVLHTSYDPVSRPKSQTHVKTGLNILAIDKLNLKDQKLTMAGWLTFEWEDERLTWNKTAKDDIEYIFTKPDSIWKPEVVIDNSIEDLGIIKNPDMLLRVKHTGGVEWQPPIMFITHCQVDVTYYPYDQQKCAVEVVSWAYTYDEVILDHLFSVVNMEDFVRHGEWHISHTMVEDKNLTEHIPDGSVRIYPQLDFWLFLQRRTEFYNLNVMMPIILTSLMVVMVFIVPIDSGEKVSYVLTLFLSLAVLLTIVAGSLPPTSITISVLGLYLGIVLILTALAILLTVCVIILFHKEGEPARDSVIMNMTSLAAKVTCMYLPVSKQDWTNGKNQIEPIPPQSDVISLSNQNGTSHEEVKDIPTDYDVMNPSADRMTEYHVTWKDVATIMDRFCFITFSLLTLAMNISFVMALTIGGRTTGF